MARIKITKTSEMSDTYGVCNQCGTHSEQTTIFYIGDPTNYFEIEDGAGVYLCGPCLTALVAEVPRA